MLAALAADEAAEKPGPTGETGSTAEPGATDPAGPASPSSVLAPFSEGMPSLVVTPNHFKAVASGPALARSTHAYTTGQSGAIAKFTTGSPAQVRFGLERHVTGIRVAGGCRRSSGAAALVPKRRRCRTTVRLHDALTIARVSGDAYIHISGRAGRRPLSPGVYCLAAEAVSADGSAAVERHSVFRVLR